MEILAAIRDVAIIFMAILWIVLLAVIVILLLKIKGAFDKLPQTIGPLLQSARHTATNIEETTVSIKGTASFVNRSAVTPIIRVAAIGAASRRFVQVMLGRHKKGVR